MWILFVHAGISATLVPELSAFSGEKLFVNHHSIGEPTELANIIILCAFGDLSMRKLIPAPYSENGEDVSDAYEVLLHDVLIGDATLFSRADEVEESWSIIEPILRAWKDRISVDRYRSGTWDVPGMDELLEGCVDGWHIPS